MPPGRDRQEHIGALRAGLETDSVVEVTLTGTVLSHGNAGIWTRADKATGRRYQFAITGRYGAPNLRRPDPISDLRA